MGMERQRVTVMYQPDRQLQLQQIHAGTGRMLQLANSAQVQAQARQIPTLVVPPPGQPRLPVITYLMLCIVRPHRMHKMWTVAAVDSITWLVSLSVTALQMD